LGAQLPSKSRKTGKMGLGGGYEKVFSRSKGGEGSGRRGRKTNEKGQGWFLGSFGVVQDEGLTGRRSPKPDEEKQKNGEGGR